VVRLSAPNTREQLHHVAISIAKATTAKTSVRARAFIAWCMVEEGNVITSMKRRESNAPRGSRLPTRIGASVTKNPICQNGKDNN
jgi:hypothetical protein